MNPFKERAIVPAAPSLRNCGDIGRYSRSIVPACRKIKRKEPLGSVALSCETTGIMDGSGRREGLLNEIGKCSSEDKSSRLLYNRRRDGVLIVSTTLS